MMVQTSPPSGCRLGLKAGLHALLLGALCVAMGLMHVAVKPFQRRFFCDDQSIRYPRARCTVPYYICAPVGVLTAWLTVAAAEWGWARHTSRLRLREPRHLQSLMAFARGRFSSDFKSRYFASVLFGLYYCCLGLAACDFLMGTAKNVFGRHRPYFYAVCRPEFPGGGCNASVAWEVGAVCRPTVSAREFEDAQRSFPSGHASFGLYCGAFVALYLRRRGARCLPAVLRRVVQFGAVAAGLYVAYSRVPDYKHHWSDVLAGGLLGLCMARAAVGAVPRWRPAPDEEEGGPDTAEGAKDEAAERPEVA